ncbi:unnamed protein product [Wickerhamomyces anomalus]
MESETPLDQIPTKQQGHIRLITFNINGYRTVFHYHPWNKLRKFSNMFNSLYGDIITLQEIKVAAKDVDNNIGRLEGYNTFLTVPSLKKGYSGVGVYVRVPKEDEPEAVKTALTVVKAEEGLTGVLKSHDTKKSYNQSDNCIGGYPNLDEDVAHQIDSEGRCVVIETANNTVVLSVYCPANSMGTEEGEHFRIQFLEALFSRIRNLEEMGKHVVLMGDINVSRDLIDSADGINHRLREGQLLKVQDKFEDLNSEQTINFIRRSVPRMLLNELLIDSIDQEMELEKPRIMLDLVRKTQGRKQGLYTVWNTLKNSRPGNYGSRIDLILATERLAECCKGANIWPFLMGSDHCPSIQLFLNQRKPKVDTVKPQRPQNTTAKSNIKPIKGQNQILSFFKQKSEETEPLDEDTKQNDDVTVIEEIKPQTEDTKKRHHQQRLDPLVNFHWYQKEIPKCQHNEPCVLKTSMTKENKGKKFWTCKRSRGHSNTKDGEKEFTCGYFQWK